MRKMLCLLVFLTIIIILVPVVSMASDLQPEIPGIYFYINGNPKKIEHFGVVSYLCDYKPYFYSFPYGSKIQIVVCGGTYLDRSRIYRLEVGKYPEKPNPYLRSDNYGGGWIVGEHSTEESCEKIDYREKKLSDDTFVFSLVTLARGYYYFSIMHQFSNTVNRCVYFQIK